jgi:hypothetical protein
LKLYHDEDHTQEIAAELRRRGIDAVSSHEVENDGLSDLDQFQYAERENRVMVTRNIRDYVDLPAGRINLGSVHPGLILISNKYQGNEIHDIADAIERVVQRFPEGLDGGIVFA